MNEETRLRIALHDVGGPIFGALQDLEIMERFHPPSKRGSNYQRALDSLKQRLRHAEEAYEEAKQHDR